MRAESPITKPPQVDQRLDNPLIEKARPAASSEGESHLEIPVGVDEGKGSE